MSSNDLTEGQRDTLWEQFVEVYAEEQKAFDSALSKLAAGGLAVTVSLATWLEKMSTSGTLAVVCFLAALALNLASYITSQKDMEARLDCLKNDDREGIEGNRWTIATTWLNRLAGGGVVVGASLLAWFVNGST